MYKIIAVCILLVFPVYIYAQDKNIDQVIAVVGGNIILKSDVEDMYMNRLASGETSEGDMRCEILEDLLVEKLLLSEAELDSTILATPSQINQQLNYQIQEYIAYFETEAAVEKYFNKPMAQVKSEMRQTIHNSILSGQMQNKIIENITSTPSEVRAYFRGLKDEEIPEIQAQYEYAQITIEPVIDISEENRIKARLRELKKQIEEGTRSFASMAVLYSEGPSASSGGELPFYGRAELDPTFATVAFNLKNDKISNVVESEMGYHIIQLIDRQGEKVKVRHILMQPNVEPEAMETAITKIDSLANLIRKDEINFEDAARLFSYDEDTRVSGGMVINPNTMTSKFTLEELDPEVSKVITELKINEISDPFLAVDASSRRNVYKIIKLTNKTETHKANLQDDYLLITDGFLNYKKQQSFTDWVSEQQENTYIRIDNTYTSCNFEIGNWVK